MQGVLLISVMVAGLLAISGLADEKEGAQSDRATPAVSPARPGMVTNSLKMKFVPVAGAGVMFSVWETRVQDYDAFASITGRKWNRLTLPQRTKQRGSHPAVNVSWDDARTFCAWLTEKERKAGKIGANQEYRLPYDWEWSVAAGLNENKEGSPQAKSGMIPEEYPWGRAWPPAPGTGNYCGEEAKGIYAPAAMIEGYNDGYVYTSPVGTFRANSLGLYDLGGNVWEWCEDLYDGQGGARVLRGAGWPDAGQTNLLSAQRYSGSPDTRNGYVGFRCVLTCPAGQLMPPAVSAAASPQNKAGKTNAAAAVAHEHANPGTPAKTTFSGKLACAVCGQQVSAGAIGIRLKDLSLLKQAGLTLTRSGVPVLTVDQNSAVNSNNPVFYYHGQMKQFRCVIKYADGKVCEDELDPALRSNPALTNIIEVLTRAGR